MAGTGDGARYWHMHTQATHESIRDSGGHCLWLHSAQSTQVSKKKDNVVLVQQPAQIVSTTLLLLLYILHVSKHSHF